MITRVRSGKKGNDEGVAGENGGSQPETARMKRQATPSENTATIAVGPVPPEADLLPAAEEIAAGGSLSIVGNSRLGRRMEAFTELLSHLPGDTGLAFVLIQHLDPSHESHLTELLSKTCEMPIAEVKGDTPARANHVYVISPGCDLGIADGILRTSPRPASGRNLPIDAFLTALAADAEVRPSA